MMTMICDFSHAVSACSCDGKGWGNPLRPLATSPARTPSWTLPPPTGKTSILAYL